MRACKGGVCSAARLMRAASMPALVGCVRSTRLPTQELAIFHPAGHLGQPGNPFGKDIANAGLFRALARHGQYAQVNVLNQLQLPPSELALALYPDGQIRSAVATAPLHSTDVPARGGVLLRGQPYLSELAWIRQSARRQLDYSLVGLIHTLAPPTIRDMIGSCAISPVEPWDALVCSSPSVQDAMQAMFDQWHDYASGRYGAQRLIRPELATIPLAVDVERMGTFADADHSGDQFRLVHGIDSDDAVVLWVGRLSFYEKAFPQPMFIALDRAAQQLGQRLTFVMAGWFPDGDVDRRRYHQAAEAYAPSVRLVLVDGNDSDVLAGCWSAADVFLSLVDNIQETFGLTPVEAMAAGIPVVLSDWDGYRSTVEDGVQGYLVPTLGSHAPQMGTLLANLHMLSLETYQTYVGAVAQHTAVNIDVAVQALVDLVRSPELRRRMGAAGRERANQCFSWPAVVAQYNSLFERLLERRTRARVDATAASASPLNHPFRGNPFADFEGFATEVMRSSLEFSAGASMSPESVLQRLSTVELDRMFAGLHASEAEVRVLLDAFTGEQRHCLADLQARFLPDRSEVIALTLAWLCKLGVLRWH